MWPFKKKKQIGWTDDEISRNNYEASTMWTTPLVEFLGKETDALKLASASCLINCGEWPDWVPGKPEWYDTDKNRSGARLTFCCDVLEKFRARAEQLHPGLPQTVWMSGSYNSYKPN